MFIGMYISSVLVMVVDLFNDTDSLRCFDCGTVVNFTGGSSTICFIEMHPRAALKAG